MTPREIKQAEHDAKQDAEKMALLLLLLFKRKKGFDGRKVEFDRSTAKFRIDGRAVSVATIRSYLTKIEDTYSRRLVTITNELADGKITFSEWQREFERSIRSSHILAAALILGSIEAAAGHRGVQERIDEQLSFADKFLDEMRKAEIPRKRFAGSTSPSGESGIPRRNFKGSPSDKSENKIPKVRFKGMTLGKVRARAKSYMRAIHLNYSNIELQVRIALGRDTEARRVLRAAEHCHKSAATPGCLELAQKGWMPIEEMVPIGGATCRNWCRCYIEYR